MERFSVEKPLHIRMEVKRVQKQVEITTQKKTNVIQESTLQLFYTKKEERKTISKFSGLFYSAFVWTSKSLGVFFTVE